MSLSVKLKYSPLVPNTASLFHDLTHTLRDLLAGVAAGARNVPVGARSGSKVCVLPLLNSSLHRGQVLGRGDIDRRVAVLDGDVRDLLGGVFGGTPWATAQVGVNVRTPP